VLLQIEAIENFPLIMPKHQENEQRFVWRSTITKRRLPEARKASGQFGKRQAIITHRG
jgi:hypothetical protein